MKRSLFLTLILCGLLTVSCGSESPSNNGNGSSSGGNYNQNEPTNNTEPNGEGENHEGEGEGEEGQQGQGEQGNQEKDTLTVEFDFNNFTFEGNTKEYSNVSVGDNHIDNVIKNFNSSLEEEVITGVYTPDKESGFVGLKLIDFEGTELPDLKTLQIGSGKQNGFIEISFIYSVVSMKVTAQPYYTCYKDSWTLDEPVLVYTADVINLVDETEKDYAKLTVNNEEWLMDGCVYDENWMVTGAPKIQTNEFEINSNTISLSADKANRIFVHKIELTFDTTQLVYE